MPGIDGSANVGITQKGTGLYSVFILTEDGRKFQVGTVVRSDAIRSGWKMTYEPPAVMRRLAGLKARRVVVDRLSNLDAARMAAEDAYRQHVGARKKRRPEVGTTTTSTGTDATEPPEERNTEAGRIEGNQDPPEETGRIEDENSTDPTVQD